MKFNVFSVLDWIVSFFVFVVILFLIYHMGTKLGIMVQKIWVKETLIAGADAQVLHGIAHAIVLVKAYKILVSYLKTHHLSIKYLVEISIIAGAIEVIFNATSHDIMLNIIFGIFAILNLILYLIFYEKLAQMEVGENKIKREFKSLLDKE